MFSEAKTKQELYELLSKKQEELNTAFYEKTRVIRETFNAAMSEPRKDYQNLNFMIIKAYDEALAEINKRKKKKNVSS